MLTLDELKSALRIDGSEDDNVLISLLSAAKSYLKGAGVPESLITGEDIYLYNQALILYIGMDYEYDDRKIPKLERAFQRILLQLKAGLIPNPDESV